MALALPATGGAGNTPGSVTTLSIANFTVSGTDKVLYVGVMSNTFSVPASPTCIWDAAGANQSFTKIAETTGTSIWCALFRLINPTDGTNKTISLAGLPSGGTDSAIAALLTGVDQTTPNDTVEVVQDATTPTSKSSGTITSPSGDWIAGFAAVENNNSASLQQQGAAPDKVQNTGNNNATLGFDTDQDGADDTFDWSWTTAGDVSLLTFNVNAAAGGGTTADLAATEDEDQAASTGTLTIAAAATVTEDDDQAASASALAIAAAMVSVPVDAA